MNQPNRLPPIFYAKLFVALRSTLLFAAFAVLLDLPIGVTGLEVAQAQHTSVEEKSVDRATCYLPSSSPGSPDKPQFENIVDPAKLLTSDSVGWQNYLRLWKSFRNDSANKALRRYFGFANRNSRSGKSDRQSLNSPFLNSQDIKILRGRSAPRWLAWRPGSYQQVETSHFTIYTRADRQLSSQVASKLEECYWVWTQMFFPLWEAAPQVSGHLESLSGNQSVAEFLDGSSKRITIRRRMSVVLFRDTQQYVATLGQANPNVSQSAIAQSTGFYSDNRRTTFLIGQPLDLPTLRHELVHQLFREATRSGLDDVPNHASSNTTNDDSMPGSQRDFWLVEGIAGYFESMSKQANGCVTLGGWDSPRLQFARYRVLSGGDDLPMDDLRRDGRLAAQSRTDLSRWYAHAIARTHQLMDAGDRNARFWIYQKLAELYKIDAGLGSPSGTIPNFQSSNVNSINKFLKINDGVVQSNPPTRPLVQLCLARCDLTAAGIKSLPESPDLRWLDLTGLPIEASDVTRLLPEPRSLRQLSLEATKVDDRLSDWLRRGIELREVDLSWTKIGDQVVESLSNAKQLSTLWLTGSSVSDSSVDAIAKMKSLSSVDVQRTKVSESGVSQLKAARPRVTVNPLQLISQ